MSTDASSRACVVIRRAARYQGKQGHPIDSGVSAESAGSRALWLGHVRIPPGGRTNAHLHERHETALYVVEGEAEMWSGDELRDREVVRAGEYVYIPANVPHVAVNRSDHAEVVAIVARTDPNEQESVVLRPELERRVPR